MNKTLIILSTLVLLISGLILPQASAQPMASETVSSMKSINQPDSKLRHVVLFAFKDSATPENIQMVEKAFSALPDKIPQIAGYEWGKNNSPEGLNTGLTHCFFVTFNSEEDRAVYLPHPDHQAFVKVLQPHLERAVVVDYWSRVD